MCIHWGYSTVTAHLVECSRGPGWLGPLPIDMETSTSGQDDENLRLLCQMFGDMARSLVEDIYYHQCDRDVSETMKALGELAKDPTKQLPTSIHSSSARDDHPLSDGLGSPGSLEVDDNGGNWDLLTGVSQTLVDTGAVLTQGLTSIANSLTGWVADLASAFDGSGWNDNEELPPGHTPRQADVAVVAHGGSSDSRPVHQRRAGASGGGAAAASAGSASYGARVRGTSADGGEEEGSGHEDQDVCKDD